MTNLLFIGFLQALGIVSYISLVAVFMNNLENMFGQVDEFFAPIIMLTLLSFSVLMCGLLALGHPIHLFWIKKKPAQALRIVAYTALFLLLFFLLFVAIITLA